MSTLKTLLTKLEQELRRNSKGELLNDPAVDNIDPIDNADIDTPDEFEKEVQKKVKGESSKMVAFYKTNSGVLKAYQPDSEDWKFILPDGSERWKSIGKDKKSSLINSFKDILRQDLNTTFSSKDLEITNLKEAQELESQSGGDIPHTHKYIPGKNRSEESLGHDHPLEYKNGKVVMLGEGPHEGHYHEV
jgi:hypothetical protein